MSLFDFVKCRAGPYGVALFSDHTLGSPPALSYDTETVRANPDCGLHAAELPHARSRRADGRVSLKVTTCESNATQLCKPQHVRNTLLFDIGGLVPGYPWVVLSALK